MKKFKRISLALLVAIVMIAQSLSALASVSPIVYEIAEDGSVVSYAYARNLDNGAVLYTAVYNSDNSMDYAVASSMADKAGYLKTMVKKEEGQYIKSFIWDKVNAPFNKEGVYAEEINIADVNVTVNGIELKDLVSGDISFGESYGINVTDAGFTTVPVVRASSKNSMVNCDVKYNEDYTTAVVSFKTGARAVKDDSPVIGSFVSERYTKSVIKTITLNFTVADGKEYNLSYAPLVKNFEHVSSVDVQNMPLEVTNNNADTLGNTASYTGTVNIPSNIWFGVRDLFADSLVTDRTGSATDDNGNLVNSVATGALVSYPDGFGLEDATLVAYSIGVVNDAGYYHGSGTPYENKTATYADVWQNKETAYDWYSFDVSRDAEILVFANGNVGFLEDEASGYSKAELPLEDSFRIMRNMTGPTYYNNSIVYSKKVNAGTTVTMKTPQSKALYAVFVKEAENCDTDATLSTLTVNGNEVFGFDKDTAKYTYTLSEEEVASMTAPEVAGIANSENATVNVTYSNSFPGSATVAVNNVNGGTKIYKVDFVYNGDMVTALTHNGSDSTSVEYERKGMVVGVDSNLATDRKWGEWGWYINELSPELIGNDKVYGGINTDNDITAVTMTLKRPAIVKVLYVGGAIESFDAELANAGFDLCSDVSSVKIHGHNANPGDMYYYRMYTKFCGKGTITVPYYGGVALPTLYAIEYAPYENDAVLTSLSINGNPVSGFRADVKEYNYTLSDEEASEVMAPVISYQTYADDAEVTINTVDGFPGASEITVVANGAVNKYKVNYAYAGDMVSAISADNGSTFKYYKNGVFESTAENFSYLSNDREWGEWGWHIKEITVPSLIGNDSIVGAMGSDDGVTSISFTLKRPATVKVLHIEYGDAYDSMFTNAGFKLDPDTTSVKVHGYNANPGNMYYKRMYTKDFATGEVTVPSMGNLALPVLYAIEYKPFEVYTESANDADLTSITINGNSLPGFDSGITEYTYALSDAEIASITAPVIVATPYSDSTTVTVEKPTTFPGSTKITVAHHAGKTKTYTINYAVSQDLVTNVVGNGGAAFEYEKNGVVVGTESYLATDRKWGVWGWHINEINDPALVGNDKIYSGIGSDAGTTSVNFTLARPAIVKILHIGGDDVDAYFEGFTHADTSSAKVVGRCMTNDNPEEYGYRYYYRMYSKEFSAGNVSVPYFDISLPMLIAVEYLPFK